MIQISINIEVDLPCTHRHLRFSTSRLQDRFVVSGSWDQTVKVTRVGDSKQTPMLRAQITFALSLRTHIPRMHHDLDQIYGVAAPCQDDVSQCTMPLTESQPRTLNRHSPQVWALEASGIGVEKKALCTFNEHSAEVNRSLAPLQCPAS